jgi:putative membrane protein
MEILIRWLLSSLSVVAAAYLLPGIHVANFLTAVIVSLVLGILNAVVKPLLVLLTLPITILTMGFFTFIINALLILLTSIIVHGFVVDGFLWALAFSVILSLTTLFTSK